MVEGAKTAIDFVLVDAVMTSALEEMVRQACAKLLPSIPEDIPPSQLTSATGWTESQPLDAGLKTGAGASSPAPRCIASELPEWNGASASEKKALLQKCRPKEGGPTPSEW